MLLLASTSDNLRVITSGTPNVDVHASFVDLSGTTITPGRQNTTISTAATTDVVASPAASTFRTIKSLHIRNRHATTANTVTVVLTDGTNAMELIKITLGAGWHLHYDEGAGFEILDQDGRSVQNSAAGSLGAAVNSLNLVVLGADVTNNNAVANTIADVTGLSFSVNANEGYLFRFLIPYTAAATTTGSRWSINGPASPTLCNYSARYALTATSESVNYSSSYDLPSAANASSLTAGNIAVIEGFIQPSASGTVVARFASEVASSAIVAKKGALLQWYRAY